MRHRKQWIGLLASLWLAAQAAHAQTASGDSFEDLANRAQAALDSRPSEAADLLGRALALKPGWAEGWFYRGAALYQAARYAEATDAFRKGIRLNGTEGIAWAFLGMSEAELENADQALADIRKGEDLGLGANRDFEVAARVKAARVLIQRSAFDDALSQLRPLARFEQDFPAVTETMGLCALAVPQPLGEIAGPRKPIVEQAGKAAWLAATRKPVEAEAAYQDLLSEYPKEPGVHYAHGLFLLETEPATALAEFQKEVALDPSHWPSLIVIGSLEARQGAPERALEAVRTAMQLAPANYRWLCHSELGRAYLTLDKAPEAVAQFEIAVRLMPTNSQVHFYLAQAYRRAGRMSEANRETAEFQRMKSQEDPLAIPARH